MFTVIPQYPDYEINLARQVRKISTGRILKRYKNKAGYETVSVRNSTTPSRNVGIHRLMLMAFKPNENYDQLVCNHINGIRNDNRIENLEWCTQAENLSIVKRTTRKYYQYYSRGKKHYRVVLKIKGKAKTIGYYKTEDEAITAYKTVYLQIHGVQL
jgi:hypothetical protein